MNPRAMIPIEHPLPEGYEAVAFRVPRIGETFLTAEGDAAVMQHASDFAQPRLILRKKWTWPDWLKCAVVTRDADGEIYGWYFRGCMQLIELEFDKSAQAWDAATPGIGFIELQNVIDLGLPELPPSESIWRNPNL